VNARAWICDCIESLFFILATLHLKPDEINSPWDVSDYPISFMLDRFILVPSQFVGNGRASWITVYLKIEREAL
jgi:hypothetical protein